MKISVITPAIRKDELELNYQSLKRQTFRDFEWIVCSPFSYDKADIWVPEPNHEPNDFMGENKAYNQLFQKVNGELIVTLNDSLWLKGDVLEKFWQYYKQNKKSCFCFMGNHYKQVIVGYGIDMTYEDVRQTQYYSPISTTTITNFDACCSSIPTKAIKQAGFIDPVWDKYCCFGIRSLMFKIQKLGYTLYISNESEYLGQKHTKEYDKENLWGIKFREGEKLYNSLYQ